jgi:hypothetical protein
VTAIRQQPDGFDMLVLALRPLSDSDTPRSPGS